MVTNDNAEEIIENSKADFYLIVFIAENGSHYSWGHHGFSKTPLDEANGFLDMAAINKYDALKQFSEALKNAKRLPLGNGILKISPMPKFS